MQLDEARHHNQPPLEERLALDYDAMKGRSSSLLEAVLRTPEKIEDEEQAQNLTDFIGQLKAFWKDADAKRKVEKAPHDQAAKAVQTFFKSFMDPIDAKIKPLENKLGFYTRAKQEIEAKARRADAKRLEMEAAKNAAHEPAAEEAAKEAAAPKQAMGKVKGNYGTQSVSREILTFEVGTLNAGSFIKLKDYLKPEAIDQAVRAYIKDNQELCNAAADYGTQPIPGVTFKYEMKTHVR